MDDRIVECLPNFSEARRPEVIDQIIHEIQSVDQVVLLDRHSDLDHNRTILSFIGHPQAVEEAAYRAIRIAAELIDMNQHTGHHPRIGAADVVPFVPIRNISMEECVALSRRLAQRVGEQLKLPVYLYDQSAARPDRQHLDDLRRGEYEQLKTAIESDPNRVPDFGPPVLGSAGAVIIGARNHLVNFNVFLNTPNLDPAQRIAKCIRHSSGGLRFVDAAGIPLEGKAVVSLVVTDFQRTRLSRIFEMIEAEAVHLGVRIEYTRIVGLIPMQALLDTAAWKLRLSNFNSNQILETHLDQACQELLDENSGTGFLDQLASTTPTPAGGSAAAFTAAQAAALLVMIAGITLSKKKYAGVHDHMQAILKNAETWQMKLAEYVQIDARTFEENITAARLPQDTPAEKEHRAQQMQEAAYRSAEIPLECARLSIQVIQAAQTLAASGNFSTIGDAAAAGALARSAVSVFTNNIKLNLKSYRQQDRAAAMIREAEQIDAQAGQLLAQTQQILQTRAEI